MGWVVAPALSSKNATLQITDFGNPCTAMHAKTDVVQFEMKQIMLLHGTILMAMANAQQTVRVGYADPGTDTCCPDDIDEYLSQLQTSHGVGTEPMSYTLGNERGVCCHIDRGLIGAACPMPSS